MGRLWWLTLLFMLVACSSSQVRRADGIAADSQLLRGKRVLLMPPEVQLSELKASGLEELRADWTATATELIGRSLSQILAEQRTELREFAAPADPALLERFRQLRLLYEVVGNSAALYGLQPVLRLASKGKAFDWTLGPGVADLGEHFGADYVLFTYVQDSYATGARKSLVVVGTLLGMGMSVGQRFGHCSLVDLRSGAIVWTGLLVSSTGDLRNAEDALAATRQMLKGAPL
jgi:hypothetical protein